MGIWGIGGFVNESGPDSYRVGSQESANTKL
jgi:hypothetical protein